MGDFLDVVSHEACFLNVHKGKATVVGGREMSSRRGKRVNVRKSVRKSLRKSLRMSVRKRVRKRVRMR